MSQQPLLKRHHNIYMPIDVSLLRSERDRSKLKRWQQLRRKRSDQDEEEVDDDNNETIIAELVELDVATRNVSRELETERILLHRLQQSLAPPHNRKDKSNNNDQVDLTTTPATNETRQEILSNIRRLKSKTIPSLELQLKDLSEHLSSKLCLLGTFVDEKILQQYPDNNAKPLSPSFHESQDSVVLAWDIDNYYAETQLIVSHLQQALLSYALDVVKRIPSSSFQIQHLSNNERHRATAFTKKELHEMMGCSLAPTCCCICKTFGSVTTNDTIRVPSSSLSASIDCLSRIHSGKIYMEQKLPMIEACLSTYKKPPTSATTATSQLPLFWNKIAPDSDGSSSLSSSLPPPPSSASLDQQLELLILYNSPIDRLRPVRDYQTQLVNHLVHFYQSLLVPTTTTTISSSSTNTTTSATATKCYAVSARALAPHLLLPCEASRIVIEGMVASADDSSSTITLGFVSNCLDYVSRACQVKTRPRPGEKADFVYTLHVGWIMNPRQVVEWMLQLDQVGMDATASATTATTTVESNVTARRMLASSTLVPYLPQESLPFLQQYQQQPRNENDASQTNATDLATTTMASSTPLSGVKIIMPLEDACNPFNFLPLGQTYDHY